MTIRDFCTQYGYKITTVSTLIREEAIRKTVQGEEDDLASTHVDTRLSELGIHVRSPAGHTRFKYEVLEYGRLQKWIGDQLGPKLLTESEISLLLDYALWLSNAAHERNGYEIHALNRENEMEKADLDDSEWIDKLDHLLRKAGHMPAWWK